MDSQAPVLEVEPGTGFDRIRGRTEGGWRPLFANIDLQAVKQGPLGAVVVRSGPEFRPHVIVGRDRVEQQEGAHGLLTERG